MTGLPWRDPYGGAVVIAPYEVRFTRCLNCGERLKAEESRKRGFGPQCADRVPGYEQARLRKEKIRAMRRVWRREHGAA